MGSGLVTGTEVRPIDEMVKATIREQRFPWIEAIGTRAGRGSGRLSWPAFAQVHARIMRGQIALLRVRVPGATGAFPDAERANNQRALGALPDPFRAVVDMAQAASPDGDGTLAWSTALTMSHYSRGQDARFTTIAAAPEGCALEIGDTDPRVTLAHLAIDGAVARWPYRSPWLWLLADLTYSPSIEGDLLTAPTPGGAILTIQSSEEYLQDMRALLDAVEVAGQDPMLLLAEATESLRNRRTLEDAVERAIVDY